jgi:CheY-like chemotaxis protein
LVVDDEQNMRTTLADILIGEGFDVSTAESGEKALKLCGRHDFDVVLMDVRMPGIDGLEAFRRIRKKKSGARVIMMSAYAVDHLERAALAEGAIAFLRKPLDPARMLQLLAEPQAP